MNKKGWFSFKTVKRGVLLATLNEIVTLLKSIREIMVQYIVYLQKTMRM